MTTADQVLDEVRAAVREAAGPRSPGETLERALERAAFRLGISYSRAWAYWYGRVRVIHAHEYLNIRTRAQARRQARMEALREELRTLEALDRAEETSTREDMAADAPRVLAGRRQP